MLERLILLIMLERFTISNQVLDRLPDVFAGVVSFSFDKVLFGSSLSSFVENSFYFVNLVGYYFDLFFLYFG